MRQWTQTNGCASRLHCKACIEDVAWKERMRKKYVMPDVCPFGITRAPERIPGTRDPVQAKCVHLGEATGESVACKSCKGKVMVKLFDCSLHGNACLGKAPDGYRSCAACGDYKTE